MTSTFVNDLRLNEMATGDQSGSWGTVTNTNLELIGEALGYGTEGITTNANTHTSTIADGATDPVRALYVEYTGTLDSACTITIAPNTVNKVCFIENGTSGSQNIIIKQGSGATITIPAGQTKAVYLDGAGSGAKVVDAFASLSVVDLIVSDDLVVGDDLGVGGDIDLEGSLDVNGTTNLDVVDIDGAVDMASTLTVGGLVTVTGNVDASGTFLAGSSDSIFAENNLAFKSSGSAFIDHYTVDANIIFRTSDSSALDTTALTLDGSAGGAATFSGSVIIPANLQHAGDSDTMLQFSAANTVRLIAGNVETFKTTASEVSINDGSADVDFRVESNGNANMFVVDANADSGAGQVCIGQSSNSPAGVNAALHVAGLANTRISIDGSDSAGLYMTDSGGEAVTIRNAGGDLEFFAPTGHEFVFNDNASDVNFRAETQGNANAVFVDAGANNVCFGNGGANGAINMGYFHLGANNCHLNVTNTQSGNTTALYYANRQTSNGTCMFFQRAGSSVGSISVTTGEASYNTTSDYRLKENIVYNWDATTRLKQLKPARFNFIIDADTTVDGFLAHEAQAVVPEAVHGSHNEVDDEGNAIMQQMDKSKFVPLLVKTIQELEARITALENA